MKVKINHWHARLRYKFAAGGAGICVKTESCDVHRITLSRRAIRESPQSKALFTKITSKDPLRKKMERSALSQPAIECSLSRVQRTLCTRIEHSSFERDRTRSRIPTGSACRRRRIRREPVRNHRSRELQRALLAAIQKPDAIDVS